MTTLHAPTKAPERVPSSLANQLRGDFKPCGRCGIERRYKGGRINLCRDCTTTLTPREREMWR